MQDSASRRKAMGSRRVLKIPPDIPSDIKTATHLGNCVRRSGVCKLVKLGKLCHGREKGESIEA